ncbi:betaine/proline/choline family ABC transporter ATP-binding protein [Pseudooceanicola sp. CBS1P-1]|uniref:Quaternary amine transport ATP-binding protein n=1 Tax=Pseudooceanicola albus TaxID=2692189 RepID=A0A6L7G5F0_9RHOB|nr:MULTISPECIES: betaine/proline/choline family ABC transporter ATP-binding protein [Pseudooceanicola]MBT9385995.1 betaine/proline/choline family ABC transporter ATP-binding protein [Pseudooceanicola endophyticus]MXN19584.1 betaine/proline/choline family ABC transporter ATP-binding protein [Pseudooceanicola albus]
MTETTTDTPKISIRHLYKVFGEDPQGALARVRDGLSKADLLESHGHVLGLNDINIDMHAGKITVIMGLSGSGKSTLIRHLNRLIEPTAGEVLLDGEDILSFNEARLRELRRTAMSMVFQKFALLPHRTVLDNAGMALATQGRPVSEQHEQARKWLDRVGLSGQDAQYPHQLSGGMQQRVGIARALASNAEIMLMDEAFSALDPLIRTDMQDLLLELQDELHKTIVFITHDLDEALKLADHLVILKDGAVIQQGEPQHILLNPSDPYIEEFVADINRARVLRVRSILRPGEPARCDGEIGPQANLETVIGMAGGAADRAFRVTRDGTLLGHVTMADVMRALVPPHAA